jgi:hypothetical protein
MAALADLRLAAIKTAGCEVLDLSAGIDCLDSPVWIRGLGLNRTRARRVGFLVRLDWSRDRALPGGIPEENLAGLRKLPISPPARRSR